MGLDLTQEEERSKHRVYMRQYMRDQRRIELEKLRKAAQAARKEQHRAWNLYDRGYNLRYIAKEMRHQLNTIRELITAHDPQTCVVCPQPSIAVLETALRLAGTTDAPAWRTHRWWREETD